ncbi:MAG: ABC-ATPase domain-containing protein, partial [Cyanobacteria bacterium P01_D01_bin.56]
MTHSSALETQLQHLDRQSYSAYKRLKGDYRFADFTLRLAHIQGDPFAAPSRVSLRVSHEQAQWPQHYWQNSVRQVVLGDFLQRQINNLIPQIQQRRGSGKSGCLVVAATSQVVLARTAVQVTTDGIELRLGVGLPAHGRRIAAQAAHELLLQDLPELVQATLHHQPHWCADLDKHIATVEDANALRQQLGEQNLVAFIANGSVLPRRSGV